MIILLIALAITLLIAYYFYKLYLKPKRLCQHYVKILKELGYRVYQIPFQPLAAPLIDTYRQSQIDYNDPLHISKHVFKNYDVIVTNILHYPNLVVTNLKLAQQILTIDKIYSIQKVEFSLKLMRHIGGEGVIFIQGDRWKQRRKILSKAFAFDFLKGIIPLISKTCDDVFDQMESASQSNGQITTQLFKIGGKIFSTVTVQGFLGIDAADEKVGDLQIQECAVEVAKLSFYNSRDPLILLFGVWLYKLGLKQKHRQLERLLVSFRALIHKKITAFKYEFQQLSEEQQKNSPYLIQSLLYHAKKDGKSLSDRELMDEILTFVAAGTETTMNLFTMMIVYIFENKEVEAQLRKQIKFHFQDEKELNYEDIKKIQLLDWVQLQAIRVGGGNQSLLDRIAKTDVLIGDIPVKQGTALNYAVRPFYYDDKIFEEPEKFKPERWSLPNQEQKSNLVLMQFSSGPRSCIGKNFALLQTKIALIKFFQRYQNLREVNKRQFIYDFSYQLKSSEVVFRKIAK